jgi:hypothetical protein
MLVSDYYISLIWISFYSILCLLISQTKSIYFVVYRWLFSSKGFDGEKIGDDDSEEESDVESSEEQNEEEDVDDQYYANSPNEYCEI